MLKLRSGAPSPFGRKVKIAAALLGIDLEVVTTDTGDPNDPIRKDNPLGKIPPSCARTAPRSTTAASSSNISTCGPAEGGSSRATQKEDRGPDAPGARRRHHGCGSAAGLRRPLAGGGASRQKWLDHQAGKVERGLAALEGAPPALPKDAAGLDVGHIAVACALGYLDLRFAGAWRAAHPRLVAWLDAFAALTPAFAKTKVT